MDPRNRDAWKRCAGHCEKCTTKLKRSGKKFQTNRDCPIKKKISGEVVRRPERGEEHQRVMAKRQIGGET